MGKSLQKYSINCGRRHLMCKGVDSGGLGGASAPPLFEQ